jgi:SAM-dependent methyltransferase
VADRVRFESGDSQALPFDDASFDVAINECAVGIPDDSQKVLDEMVRVLRPGGSIAIHESTWRRALDEAEKGEIAERYGTTPLSHDEWIVMLERAGAHEVQSELDPWSAPENFWKIRKDRDVSGPGKVLTLPERLRTVWRIAKRHGLRGLATALYNERVFYRAVLDRKLGYGLYWGRRPMTNEGEPRG